MHGYVALVFLTAFICDQASCSKNNSESVDGTNATGEQTAWMIPGTNWCGPGDIAANVSDLGVNYLTDTCCRAHDRCNMTIPALSFKWRIFNYNLYTMSHCDCEENFHKCLKDVGNAVSRMTQTIYFKMLHPSCFRLVEQRVCAKFTFDFWRFRFVCQRYHKRKVAKKFKVQDLVVQSPV